MEPITLIWFDATIATRHAEMGEKFREHFAVRYCSSPREFEEALVGTSRVAICFEFDYPDRPGLSFLRKTKGRYPQIPILMLTEQHSERLAVWAFRNKVLDYLVQPVSESDFCRCVEVLQAIQTAESRQETRIIFDHKSAIPVEIPVGQRTGDVRVAPAVFFVQKNFRCKIRNADVAKYCGMSLFHFSHVFAETFAVTFQEYVVRYRILEACKELQHPNVPVTNVAYSVGFNDPSYFARVFRRFIGVSPSEYCEQPGSREIEQRVSDLENSLELPALNLATVELRSAASVEQHKVRESLG